VKISQKVLGGYFFHSPCTHIAYAAKTIPASPTWLAYR